MQPTQTLGEFKLTANATYTDVYKLRLISGAAYQKGVGDRSVDTESPLRLKGTSSLFWTREAFTAGVTARYLGHYKDAYNTNLGGTALNPGAVRVDGDTIGSSTEFDVQGSYQFAAKNDGWRHFLNRTKVTLGARNVFDREPPYNTASQAFYSFYNDPRQRYVYLELKRAF